MTIGKRISELRKAKGYTQEYVAEQLGVSRQAVSKWEQDQTSPDTKNLIALSKLLGASIEYIAVGDDAQLREAARKQEIQAKRIEQHNFYSTAATFSIFAGLFILFIIPVLGLLVLTAGVVFFILATNLENKDDD